MSSPRLRERVGNVSQLGMARLESHTLKFQKIGVDGSAKCDIEVFDDDGAAVLGALFKFPASELAALNEAEGLGNGYESKTVPVILTDGREVEALTYFATHIADNLKPYHWYKHHVLFGARENRLPESYISKIEAVDSIDDPCADREYEQMRLYR